MAEEKIYTIPLRREWLKVPIYKRSRKAITATKEFLKKHLKKEVKIGPYLNEFIWGRGNRHPPGKVKVRIDELKERSFAELVNAPRVEEEEGKKKEEEKREGKVEKIKEDKKKEEAAEEKKEVEKKAIEKVPIDKEKRGGEQKRVKIVEDKEASLKKERVIPTEKAGQLRKD